MIIFNMSLGGGGEESAVVTEAANRSAEVHVILGTVAGYQTVDACLYHPAQAEGVIPVAAVTQKAQLAYFSSVPRVRGGVVLSVDSKATAGLRPLSGISMAAPHVAGLAALVLAEDPDAGDVDKEAVLERLRQAAPRVGGYPLTLANSAFERPRGPWLSEV